ncbi:MAG: hypothetical protein GXP23_01485 [Gammaproteobacteria bacterium]|nr:hypothetical protein [Gammaproteobacteria bacterium]
MGNRIPTAAEFTHGDMNQDGQLNVADLLLLQRQLLQAWLGMETGTAIAKANVNTGRRQTTTALPVLDWLITPAQALPSNNGFLYYVHNDPLGTPQALTNEAGTVVWTAQYDPFGKATVNEDPDNDGNTVTLNARLPGQYYDKETGLHYNYLRYYDPNIGRYLTSDPIGLEGGLNLYLYAYANPVSWMDPSGLLGIADLPSIPQPIVNAAVGFGDGAAAAITFGLLDLQDIRDVAGIDGSVDKCSGEFQNFNLAGKGVGTLAIGGALFSKFGGKFFGKGGILNRGPNFRIGVGRKGGDSVIRVAGKAVEKITGKKKIDIINRGPIRNRRK